MFYCLPCFFLLPSFPLAGKLKKKRFVAGMRHAGGKKKHVKLRCFHGFGGLNFTLLLESESKDTALSLAGSPCWLEEGMDGGREVAGALGSRTATGASLARCGLARMKPSSAWTCGVRSRTVRFFSARKKACTSSATTSTLPFLFLRVISVRFFIGFDPSIE